MNIQCYSLELASRQEELYGIRVGTTDGTQKIHGARIAGGLSRYHALAYS